jgi:hypothetical protein
MNRQIRFFCLLVSPPIFFLSPHEGPVKPISTGNYDVYEKLHLISIASLLLVFSAQWISMPHRHF